MTKTDKNRLERVASCFELEGELIRITPHGNGHINDTFLLTYRIGKMGTIPVILQRMNRSVFPCPEKLMENVMNVTSFLHQKIQENGGDPFREVVNIIPARDGKPYYQESEEDYWRCMVYITNAHALEEVRKPEDFYESAVAFGRFQSLLADYPAETLYETIANFHNTRSRLADLKKAMKEDVAGRVKDVTREIQFILDRETDAGFFTELIEKGELPIRVTHNDTKSNNVMIDDQTGKGICVIDLDTTMPGLAMYDFGDSIRFGASTGAEDEKDLSRISCSMELFEAFTRGFIEGCGGQLTSREIQLLPMGAKIMTYECGMRFLTDYLQNDIYFKTSRPEHNLDRARTQLKLVADMESKWDQMIAIVAKYLQ